MFLCCVVTTMYKEIVLWTVFWKITCRVIVRCFLKKRDKSKIQILRKIRTSFKLKIKLLYVNLFANTLSSGPHFSIFTIHVYLQLFKCKFEQTIHYDCINIETEYWHRLSNSGNKQIYCNHGNSCWTTDPYMSITLLHNFIVFIDLFHFICIVDLCIHIMHNMWFWTCGDH